MYVIRIGYGRLVEPRSEWYTMVQVILGLIWDYFYGEFHRMVLAIFWVVGEKHENNKI